MASLPHPRRIDDALSQLVDSLLPPRPEDPEDDAEDDSTIADDLRRQRALDRAWEILDYRTEQSPTSIAAAGGAGVGAIGGPHPPEVNNASDLIKRKLLRENPSPDKAVRFSNLYSRLLTQPVLAQKWAILFLMVRLGDDDAGGDLGGSSAERGRDIGAGAGRRRDRSPLLEEHQLENMLGRKGREKGFTREDNGGVGEGGSAAVTPKMTPGGWDTGLESPGPNASASQWGGGPGSVIHNSTATRGGRERRQTAADGGPGLGLGKSGRGAFGGNNGLGRDSPVEMEQQQSQAATAAPSPSQGGSEDINPPESALLHDLPFNLQGVSSTNLEFTSPSTVKLPPTLPIPLISLLHTLAEPCLLYRGLHTFVESAEGGLVGQSLRATIGNELRSYLGLVATLEGEIRRALAAATDTASEESKSVARAGVTLKRCVVWTREATMALRLMSLMVEEARSMLWLFLLRNPLYSAVC
jgi:gamma-tubulin complex component 3